jgi:hypothetical protein
VGEFMPAFRVDVYQHTGYIYTYISIYIYIYTDR